MVTLNWHEYQYGSFTPNYVRKLYVKCYNKHILLKDSGMYTHIFAIINQRSKCSNQFKESCFYHVIKHSDLLNLSMCLATINKCAFLGTEQSS